MSDARPAVSDRRNWWVRSRAVIGIFIILPFAVAAVLSPPLAPEGSWTDISFDVAGWFMFILGGAVRWWATLYIGGRKLDTVVADGPYSVCRNPIYLGTFLMGVGIAFFLQSLTFAIGVAFATTFYLWVTVPAEEMLRRAKFSQAFDDYCRRVPRYIPRFRNFHTSELLEIRSPGCEGKPCEPCVGSGCP